MRYFKNPRIWAIIVVAARKKAAEIMRVCLDIKASLPFLSRKSTIFAHKGRRGRVLQKLLYFWDSSYKFKYSVFLGYLNCNLEYNMLKYRHASNKICNKKA